MYLHIVFLTQFSLLFCIRNLKSVNLFRFNHIDVNEGNVFINNVSEAILLSLCLLYSRTYLPWRCFTKKSVGRSLFSEQNWPFFSWPRTNDSLLLGGTRKTCNQNMSNPKPEPTTGGSGRRARRNGRARSGKIGWRMIPKGFKEGGLNQTWNPSGLDRRRWNLKTERFQVWLNECLNPPFNPRLNPRLNPFKPLLNHPLNPPSDPL